MNTQFRQFITGNDTSKITRRQCSTQNWCSRVTKLGMPDSFLSSRGCGVSHGKMVKTLELQSVQTSFKGTLKMNGLGHLIFHKKVVRVKLKKDIIISVEFRNTDEISG